MKTAVIIDDNYIYRKTLIALLEHLKLNINILGEAADIKSAMEIIHSSAPDFLFLDYELPDGTGLDLISKLTYYPNVFLISGHSHLNYQEINYPHLHIIKKPVDVDIIKQFILEL